ncbi:MAG: hypothetical protein IPH75_16125 [bacterium]|nr:hypothetical protein [bacterium]
MSDTISNMVHKAMYKPVGKTVDEVIAWFASKPFSQKEVFLAHATALQDGDDPSTLWRMVQGLTASARSLPHIDARVSLERRAGALLC